MAESIVSVCGKNSRVRELMSLYHSPDPEVSTQAISDLVNENGGLVNFLIEKHYSSYKAKYQEDLFQAGICGLIESFKTFDPDKGTLSTHAAHYIEHELHDYITSFVNGIKPHYSRNIKKVRRAKEILSAQGNETPSATDIAMETGLSVTEVRRAIDVLEKSQVVSTESDEVRDAMLSSFAPGPSEKYDEKELLEILYKALSNLSVDEKTAICMKYRLGPYADRHVITNADIAEAINVPIPNVKGILANAIRKLRTNKALSTMLTDNLDPQKDRTSDVSVIPMSGAIKEIEYLLDGDVEYTGKKDSAEEFFSDCSMNVDELLE